MVQLKLFSSAEAGGVDVGGLGLEAVEAPDEGQFEIARHVAYFHPVVLAATQRAFGRAYGEMVRQLVARRVR